MSAGKCRLDAKECAACGVAMSVELDGVGGLWESYHALSSQSLGITTVRLEHALTSQTVTLADRIIGDYRSPTPTVRETQWEMARQALAQALAVNPNDKQLQGALRYCEGHLHRINGEARKTRRQNAAAQHEFTEAVSAFREAAELRPEWPDPFLGLMRTFIYGLEDLAKGHVMFAATGVTKGYLLDGVRFFGDSAKTESIVMRSKSGTSGYSFIILTWQMMGLRAPKLRESSACTTSGLTRTSCGKPCVSTAKCPQSSADPIACMTTMRVRPLARGAMRPQAASNDISGTRRPPQAIVPRYQAGAPSIGVGAW